MRRAWRAGGSAESNATPFILFRSWAAGYEMSVRCGQIKQINLRCLPYCRNHRLVLWYLMTHLMLDSRASHTR